MFEVSDEEDQAFWEALPCERLETDICVETPTLAEKKKNPVGSGQHGADNRPQHTPVTQKHTGKSFGHMSGIKQQNRPCEWESSVNELDNVTERNQQNTPVMKDDASRRKGKKRKFPGPAGNLPQNTTKEITSPEFVPQPTSNQSYEMLNNKEEEDPVASQPGLEEAFTSRPWKKLLADLGPSAASVLAKFNIKSMLVKANKRTLPRSKIPLILGYIERLDFHGSDGSIVLRDPSGKMNGSIHQELLKDPSTALQVGWVLVLRQVSVISPMRNHYLNITSGNIVAIYCLDKDNEVMMTSGPSHGSPLCQVQKGSPSSPSLSWDKLIEESERELKAASVQNTSVLPKAYNPSPAVNQRQSIGAATRPGLAGHRQMIPSPLFSASMSNQRTNSHQSNVGHGSRNDNAGLNFQRTSVNDEFNDDFPDDDSDMLSFCDMNMNTFDKQCESVSTERQENLRYDRPLGERISVPVSHIPSHLPSPPETLQRRQQDSTSRSLSSSSVISSAHSMSVSLANPETTKKRFSFKVMPSISSPNPQYQAGTRPDSRGFLEPQQNNLTSSSTVVDKNVNVRTNVGRDARVQLGAIATSGCKENKSEGQGSNVFGQWNDDLSDELLSQLSEEF